MLVCAAAGFVIAAILIDGLDRLGASLAIGAGAQLAWTGAALAILMPLQLLVLPIIVDRRVRARSARFRERDEMIDAVGLAAVIVVDSDGVIRHWSRGCQELYGWPPELALGRNRRELLDTHLNEVRPDGGASAIGVVSQCEFSERHRDGRPLITFNQMSQFGRADDRPSTVITVIDVTVRRAAESALRVNEERLRVAADSQGLVIFQWDHVAKCVDWDINLDRLTGFSSPCSAAEMTAWMKRAVADDERLALIGDFEAALAAGEQAMQRTVRLRNTADDICFINFSLHIGRAEGRPVNVIVACKDVTEHYRHEEAIRVSEARLATAVAAQGIFIYEYDLVADRPIWTTRGESFLGLPIEGRDVHDAGPAWNPVPEIADHVKSALHDAIARGDDKVHFSFDFDRLDGARRRADSWARIIRGEDGQPLRAIGTHLDVTERHEREAALRASEAEMRAILSTVPDAMVVCDENGIIREFSSTAEIMFGHSEADMIGRNVRMLIATERPDRGPNRRELQQVLRNVREANWPIPVVARGANGESVPVSFVIGDAIVDGARRFVIFGRDMRPHIETEERFRKLQNDLAQVSRLGMMGEMAAALAHELSQPLAAIVNFVGAAELMIEGGRANDRILHATGSAREQASRAGEIIRRLRAFITRGETDTRGEPITHLIREAAALALFNVSSLGVRVSYLFESEDRVILGDRIQIQQVLVNLIRNGVDAMTSGSCARKEMVISTLITGDNVLLVEVKDSGPGISPEILDRLFKPFATTKDEGLGFGLSISRRIIEAHGGYLTADTEMGEGAVFRFTLPILEREAQPS